MVERQLLWVNSALHPGHEDLGFCLMSYNILAEVYSKEEGYDYCPQQHMSMGVRHQAIIQEIIAVTPDVVCLQEVEETYFKNQLMHSLTQHHYDGKWMSYKRYEGCEVGLAVIYHKSRVQLTSVENVLSKDAMRRQLKDVNMAEDARAAISRLCERSQGFQIAQFIHRATEKFISVGNVHIKWCEFKLPALSCLETVCALQALVNKASGGPFVLTGDFNSPPDFATYRMLNGAQWKEGFFDKPIFTMYEWFGDRRSDPQAASKKVSSSVLEDTPGTANIRPELVETDTVLATHLSHLFNTGVALKSAYMDVMGREPQVTNCDGGAWLGHIHELCLDYLWFSPKHMVATRVLTTPEPDETRQHHGLPSAIYPSDHIPIAAVFHLQ